MLKALKILGIIDLVIAGIGVFLWLATRNANDFSGLIVIYPMIAFAVVSIAILVVSFIYAIMRALNPPQAQGGGWVGQTSWTIVLLIGIPAAGLLYAGMGEGRASFAILCSILLICGVALSTVLILKSRRG
jgi:hypothetical protein